MQANDSLVKEKHVVSREMRITNLIRPEDQQLEGVQKLNTLCSQWLEVAAQGRRDGKETRCPAAGPRRTLRPDAGCKLRDDGDE